MRILSSLKKYYLLVLLLLILITFYYLRLDEYIRLSSLQQHQEALLTWAAEHYKLVVPLYILTFAILIACTIPCATLLTIVGGMVFGLIAILYAEIAVTLGGYILFHAVRTAFSAHLTKNRGRGWIKRMEAGFRKNAFNYILMLRLMPVFPCWISNISAGMLNVPQRTFLAATAIGILPATIIYVLAGRSINALLTTHQPLSIQTILNPAIMLPLVALAIFSLFPIFYKQVKQHRKKR